MVEASEKDPQPALGDHFRTVGRPRKPLTRERPKMIPTRVLGIRDDDRRAPHCLRDGARHLVKDPLSLRWAGDRSAVIERFSFRRGSPEARRG